MFRKLVENISFSPALIESLGRYAKALKQEESIRRFGLILLALALVVQIATSIYPSEQANVASKQDFIYGGATSLNNLIDQYNKNTNHFKDITTSLGITQQDITDTKESTYTNQQGKYIVITQPSLVAEGEKSFTYTTSNAYSDENKEKKAYLSLVSNTHSKEQSVRQAFVGNSANIGWFAIDKHNGSIVLNSIPSTVNIKSHCPLGQITLTDQSCQSILSQTVHNETQNKNAASAHAESGDQLIYTFTASNNTDRQLQSEFKVYVTDLIEYARITDISDGGIVSKDQTNVEWSDIALKPGEVVSHAVGVKVLSDIPAASQNYSNQNSYDCTITTIASNTLNVPVRCPLPKLVESIGANIPRVNSLMIVAEVIFVLTALFLYLRSRQLKEEVRLIRRDINTGSID
jgi:hypothetical protein